MSLRSLTIALAFVAGSTISALAGPQYIDSSGYAVSGYDVVAYFDLEQNPVGSAQPKAVRGNAAYTADYNGAKWAFSSAENRDKFVADPARYAPQFDGHCAFGVAKGGKVPANPHLWRIVDGKLYLNITKNVVGFWEEDIPGNISTGTTNWGGIETANASDREIPEFDGAIGPVTN
ncbi:MAG: YHS domain-containing (seleno)protein [Pseudomonadota bacterium]